MNSNAAAATLSELILGHRLAACKLCIRLCEPTHRLGIAHNGQGFLEPLEVLNREKYRRWPSVHCDGHSLMVVVHAADELGEMSLDFSQGHRCHGQKYDQNWAPGQTPRPRLAGCRERTG